MPRQYPNNRLSLARGVTVNRIESMSIESVADTAAHTAVPADPATPVAPTTQPESSPLLDLLVLAWCIGAIVLAKLRGVFRRGSILGPRRLPEGVPALALIVILLAGYAVGSLYVGVFARFVHVREAIQPLVMTVSLGIVATPVMLVGLYLVDPGAIKTMGISVSRIIRGGIGGAVALFILFPMVSVASALTMLVIHWAKLPEPH